jgi:hypothetical protein
MGMSELITMIF